ncbi:MAG: hypothetical protein E7542_01480 [Ruminococcaceae bacterium]|nr:hypothetical protein [Oscillospiraceae bacterium]
MENKYFDSVLKEMQPFFDENGIKAKDGIFVSETKAIDVKYDENRQMYLLLVADIEEGNIGEFTEVNAWLFDDSQNARDAESVGIDFVNSLRKIFGVKVRHNANGIVELPTASKNGNVDIAAFTKKVLDVFPALKDEYKNHVSAYGNFLYLNFFGEHLTPRLIRLFEEGTKKQIKKFYDILENAYMKGDKDTVNATVIVLAAASYNNEKVDAAIKEMLTDNKHFLSCYTAFVPVFASNKKLVATMIK